MCSSCKAFIGPGATPGWGGLLCEKCAGPTIYKVYMQFHLHKGWVVNFIEDGLTKAVCRPKCFASADKIRAMAERAGALKTLEDQRALDYGIENGRGGLYLVLNRDQYQKLKGQSR